MSSVDPMPTYGNPHRAYLDSASLARALAKFSDEELDKLADELDFCGFSGVPSARILTLLNEIAELDDVWKSLYHRMVSRAA